MKRKGRGEGGGGRGEVPGRWSGGGPGTQRCVDKERSGVPEGARGGVCCGGGLFRGVLLDNDAGKGKGTKNAGTRTQKAQKAGAF